MKVKAIKVMVKVALFAALMYIAYTGFNGVYMNLIH